MSSWVSHFERAPRALTGLGLNAAELEANPALSAHVVHDLSEPPSSALRTSPRAPGDPLWGVWAARRP